MDPVDTKLRARGVFFPDALPAVLGCGGAEGNYAEYTLVGRGDGPAEAQALSFAQAATGPLVPLSAWEGRHDRARRREGQQVLEMGRTGSDQKQPAQPGY